MSTVAKGSKRVVIGIVVVVAVLLVLLIPAIPVSYSVQVPYEATEERQVPYQTTETVQVPFQEAVTKSADLLSLRDYTLPPNNYVSNSAQLPVDRDVQVSWSADDTVSVFVFNSDQFNEYRNGRTATPIVEKTNVATGTLGFRTAASDTYYFVLYNPHNGFFGIFAKNVGIFSASAVATWQEEVTMYRTETHTVTNFRTETATVTRLRNETRTANISLLDMLLGRKPA